MWGFRWIGRFGSRHKSSGSVPEPDASNLSPMKQLLVALACVIFVILVIEIARDNMKKHPSQGYLPAGCHWISVGNREQIPDCPQYHTPLPSVPVVTLPAQLPPLVPIERVPIPPSTTTVPKTTTTKVPKTTTTTAPAGPPPKGCHVFAPNQLVCGGTIVRVP